MCFEIIVNGIVLVVDRCIDLYDLGRLGIFLNIQLYDNLEILFWWFYLLDIDDILFVKFGGRVKFVYEFLNE